VQPAFVARPCDVGERATFMKTKHDFKVRSVNEGKKKIWVLLDHNRPVAYFKQRVKVMRYMEKKTKESMK
jgi:hypothetical protein